MLRIICAIFLAASLLVVSAACAATLNTASSKDGSAIITLVGEITDGDSDALKAVIQKINDTGRVVALIRLDSPGGSILEGVKIADVDPLLAR